MATKTVAAKASTNGHRPRSEVTNVTPNMARAWLAKNKNNRNVRAMLVRAYARDMKAGKWRLTGEAIKFDADGWLLDGQHRLLAIIESGATIQMFVIRGLEPEVKNVIDTGAGRTGTDALTFNGYKYASLMAAAARLAINWQRGEFTSAWQHAIEKVTHEEILEFIAANDDFRELAAYVGSEWSNRIPAKPAVILFTSWVTSRIDADLMMAFYGDLADFRTAGKGDPRATLLKRLQSVKINRERMSAVTQADLFFRAWNAVRAGKDANKFSPKHDVNNFTDPK